jgi:hypothetical protein
MTMLRETKLMEWTALALAVVITLAPLVPYAV